MSEVKSEVLVELFLSGKKRWRIFLKSTLKG
jgi:hypothetical protein